MFAKGDTIPHRNNIEKPIDYELLCTVHPHKIPYRNSIQLRFSVKIFHNGYITLNCGIDLNSLFILIENLNYNQLTE